MKMWTREKNCILAYLSNTIAQRSLSLVIFTATDRCCLTTATKNKK